MIKAQEVKLYDILPSILKNDKTIAAIAKVLQKYINENYEYIERLNILSNIDNIENEELIDHLAYQFHVDFYDPSLNLDKKRKLVKRSIAQHRKKGTPMAVERLMQTIFGGGGVEEWFEYDGDPYHFKAMVDISALSDGLDTFHRALNTVKNTRSHLEEFIGKKDVDLQLQTKQETYPINYNRCGTFLCGTKPYVQTEGISFNTQLNVNANKTNTSQRYKLTGTFKSGEAKL
ncbi:phage tail protein [Tissierella praeacuta]|uniref:phage tail protein n=1 Tax=Tissierella praeacuta TaxID=43131 RepID=UPI003DA27251